MNKVVSTILSLNKKQEIAILSVLVVVLSLVVFGPVLGKLRSRRLTQKSLRNELSKLQEKANLLAGIEPILINERVSKMEAVFPSKKPVVELLGTLSMLSVKRNLVFGGVSLNPGTLNKDSIKDKDNKSNKEPGLDDLSFGFKIEGSFDDVLGFLKDLENVAPLMKLEEVSLSIQTNPLFDTKDMMVGADVKVASYYQPPPKSLGSINTPVKLLSRKDEAVLNQLINFTTFEAIVPVAQTGKENLFE